jgi:hypothetical protein
MGGGYGPDDHYHEPVIGCVTVRDAAMYPLFAAGQVAFYKRGNWRGVGAVERTVVVRYRGLVLVRCLQAVVGGWVLFGVNQGWGGDESGAIKLCWPEGWRPNTVLNQFHPDLEVLGPVVDCQELYRDLVRLPRSVRTPEQVAEVLFTDEARRNRRHREIDPLFVAFAN